MAEHFISSGNEVLDELSGGIEKDVITTMYGPAGVGKSNFCILTAVDVVTKGGKVVYIDTDGSFSPERLRQVAEARGEDPKQVLENMVFFKPVNFQEQKVVFDKLKSLITDKIGLVVVDSIAMLYRLEMGRSSEDVYGINKELGRQLSYLSEIARKRKIPILVTNQVYSSFEEKDKVHMVGGDILRYSSKCLIELRAYRNVRKAILKRHRSQPEGKEALFRIIQEGVEKVDEEETRVSEAPEPQPARPVSSEDAEEFQTPSPSPFQESRQSQQ